MMKQYKHKIKSIEEIKEIIGDFPRDKKVIMCHGVFDVVHPGHVRHLLYAKSKADFLIASTTADEHNTKGKYRPHIPQELRAVNLAAFEVVDFVIIDKNPTPLQNIAALQPDYFAKGYEYVEKGIIGKTSEEAQVVEAYGGEIIFTPGDVVYSSSNLITMSPPALKIEKLLATMEAEGISFDSLKFTLKKMHHFTVHVVGDTIVDSYTQTTMIGGQTKTPTMSVLYENQNDYVGGAAIVAKHLRATGAKVVFSTVLGEGKYQNFVIEDLKTANISTNAIIDATRPITHKNAIVANQYRLLKIDTVDNTSISDNILLEMADKISNTPCDAVIFSDFRHGIFNKRTIPKLSDAIPKGVFRVADSQVASRWGNILEFDNFDLITPNEREARFALGDQDSGIRPLAAHLYNKSKCKTLMLKLGNKGVLTCKTANHEDMNSFFVVDSFVEHLQDAVGAGDALLAYASLALLATHSEAMATILGSIAAACECEFDGNIPITPERILEKIKILEKMVSYADDSVACAY